MKLKITNRYIEAYYFLLALLYFLAIRDMWFFRKITEKTGLTYEFNAFKFTVATLFVLYTIHLFKSVKFDFFSKNILGLVLLLDFIPSTIFHASVSVVDWRIYALHVILFYSLFLTFKFKFKINIKPLNKKQSAYVLAIIILIGVLPYLRYIQYIDVKNLLLQNIYTTRFKFEALFDAYSKYSHSWFTRVIIPIIFVLALKFKWRLLAVLNAMLLITLYLMGAVKSVLLGSLLVLIFYVLPHKKLLQIITKGLVVLLLISIGLSFYVVSEHNTIALIIFRRLMFLPSLLDYCFFDFFNDNYLYWSNSFLKFFIDYPYPEIAAKLIGDTYFDMPEMAANNGLISDGFSNAGFLGALLTILLFNSYMLVIKNCNINSKFFGIYFFILYGFLTSAFSVVLITHGGILLLLISVFVLRESKIRS